MNNPTYDSFIATLEELGRALAKAGRYAVDAISTMSWPMLLACCVALALFMTVLPLAIFLFVVFIAARMVYKAFDQRAKRGKATAYKSVDESADKPGE